MTTLQFISHQNSQYTYLEGIQQALLGGCKWIQLRMKEAPQDELIAVGRQVKELCLQHQATFIIDDHADLVQPLGADGVHLGQKDMPIREARSLLGDKVIIGGTANTFEEIRNLQEQGADYIGCGPYRYTTTKKKLAPTLGIEGYKRILQRMEAEKIHLPLIAIGGIGLEDIPNLIQIGVSGIAISSTILNADNPRETTKEIIKIITNR